MEFTKQTHILFLPAWYPNRFDKMPGMFARQHAIALKNKLTIHVLHVVGQKKLNRWFEFTIVPDEVKTYIMYYRKPKYKNIFNLFFEGFLYAVATILAYINYRKIEGEPNIFHVHVLTRAAILPLFLSFFYNINYVITEHWSRYFGLDNTYKLGLRKWLTKLAVKRSKGLSTVSLALKNAMIAQGLNHVNFPVISNVVDAIFFKPVISKEETSTTTFLHVSCFDEKSKNLKGMLKAFKILENQSLNYKLILVGIGPDKLAIQGYAAQLAVKNVFFVGELLGINLVKQYQNAHALILFSNYENQPCVILEAQACGLPVIASNVGGIPELVNPSNGVLVNAGNEQELAAILLDFINHKLVFNKQEIKAQAANKYSEKVVKQQFLDFYNQAFK